MEKKRTSKATSNLKSATTKAKATVKSTVEKIEKTPAAEKTVKAVKKATETVAAKAPEVVEEAKGLKGKELHIYVNAEERAAYYTADGEGSDDYKIDLTTL